ncbi:uncharacterized protein LOC129224113 isoform X2 [Uloborus diversus]|uniref:uncharacterized protein LOC129224113 isoform X2 n=1 Tax=Uloborus diversus TaxID=327109 RepID=UPI002409A6C6|nr:uncharacterized protein LOC129224113 isoform X2 [Uloborus diversus]
MFRFIFLALFAVVIQVYAHHEENHDPRENAENVKSWRDTICEKDNDSLNNEMEVCFQLESKSNRDATADCAKEAVPSSNGKTVKFMKEACKNREAFKKFDDCFAEYYANPVFRSQMEVSRETVECYNEVLKKYNIEELSFVFNETHANHGD